MASKDTRVSPVGTDHATARRRRQQDPAYQAASRELAPYEQLARMVIVFRMQRELTQQQLADQLGTSVSAVSRLESGNHRPNVETLQKLAHAFDRQLVIGFIDPIADPGVDPIHAKVADHDADLVALA